jgi:SAM-dependent methyltransferase
MSDAPMIEPSEHPMVVSAMARLATQGGWARILAGKPLEDVLDLNDAQLLVAARVLQRNADDSLEPVDSHPWYFDPTSLAGGMLAYLRRALRHAEGGAAGWDGDDLDIVVAQGRGSISAAVAVGEGLIPQMSGAHRAFLEGGASFLDVGVGIGVVAGKICEMFPGTTAVGLDVLAPVLDLARSELEELGLLGQVELRLQSVVDLRDVERFDLAWLPQQFIPRHDLEPGIRAVFRALRHDRWLVAPVVASSGEADAFERAIHAHGAHLTGGGAITVEVVSAMMRDAGFVEISDRDFGGQVVMLGRRP